MKKNNSWSALGLLGISIGAIALFFFLMNLTLRVIIPLITNSLIDLNNERLIVNDLKYQVITENYSYYSKTNILDKDGCLIVAQFAPIGDLYEKIVCGKMVIKEL